MAKQFRLQVYTQERKVLDEQVTSVVAPTTEGYFGILADHAPIISALGEGNLTVRTGEIEKEYRLGGGFLEMSDNNAVILADSLTNKGR